MSDDFDFTRPAPAIPAAGPPAVASAPFKAAQSRFYDSAVAARIFRAEGKEERFPQGQTIFMEDDKELAVAFREMGMQPTPEARQAAFARMQKRALDQAYVVPFGSITQVQGFRANVKGFKPFRIPRVSNVWFE